MMSLNALRRGSSLLPLLALTAALIGFVCLPLYAGRPLETYDLFNLFEAFAQIGLVTLGFGLLMMAGEFDLSIVGVYALSGVIAVKVGQDDPLLGVAVALGICVAFGALQGLLISWFQIASMPVTVGTYIALLGLTRVIGDNQASVPFDDIDATLWIQEPVATLFSPRSLIVLGVFAVVALLCSATKWGREVRALGGDRKASRTAGVPVNRRLVALFAASSLLGAIAGVLSAFSAGAAITDPGSATLSLGVAGALIGGVALAGGRGSVPGILAGAMSIVLLGQIFFTAGVEEFYSDLVFGLVLLVIVAFNAPSSKNWLVRLRADRAGRDVERSPAPSTP
ncbi:MAG: transporter permease [Aeromicrobium sp.]|jgi:ribose transport system permease protein|nr:transporter permease [Aeromicrobium sp.]